MIKPTVLVAVITASLLVQSSALGQHAGSSSLKPLTVAQLEIATIALERFRKDQPNADRNNVLVTISESEADVRVAFQPRVNPSVVGHDGDRDYVTMDNPSGNQYGKYVQYQISKKTKKIVDWFFAH